MVEAASGRVHKKIPGILTSEIKMTDNEDSISQTSLLRFVKYFDF